MTRKNKKETKADRLKRLKAQGRYLAAVSHLPKTKRSRVREMRDKFGIRAAMRLARSFKAQAA